MLNNVRKFLPFIAVAFIGGFFAYIFLSWWKSPPVITGSDAVAIANTYIVFTTIIFVAFTLVITLLGYVFTQQFAHTKEMHIKHLLNEVEEELKSNKNDQGIKFIDAAFENPDIQKHVENKINDKLTQLVNEKKRIANENAGKAKTEADKIEEISSQLKGG